MEYRRDNLIAYRRRLERDAEQLSRLAVQTFEQWQEGQQQNARREMDA